MIYPLLYIASVVFGKINIYLFMKNMYFFENDERNLPDEKTNNIACRNNVTLNFFILQKESTWTHQID